MYCRAVLKYRYTEKLKIMQLRKLSSYEIRRRFVEYFTSENSHTFVRSSPVVPLYDGSLAFVNAGMNQFKDIFLDKVPPPCLKAVNSQKCIRVGGKHNDLLAVGSDTYHHTFFEMLGNWSFGDYFKQEACVMAWNLLTSPPYSIDPRRLYVTYFSGCTKLGLPPDLETKDIWRSLGIPSDHILGFGVKDNFWEMGATGPCGPCTEIHIDLTGRPDAALRVNGGHDDVTELWNIVFIQYNRQEDGSLSRLARHHVDTGMGLERLVALLQGQRSNYDTDLFLPLFDTIAKGSGAATYGGRMGKEDEGGRDTAYRVLADHTRMATVAIADNMFPDQNHKLRRVLRKALQVAEQDFKMRNAAKLVKEVSSRVADILSSTYPEIGRGLSKVQLVVEHEWEVMTDLRKRSLTSWRRLTQADPRLAHLTGEEAPGLCDAYQELISADHVSPELAFRLYDSHGLSLDLIEELCEALGMEFHEQDFKTKLEAKKKSMQSSYAGIKHTLSQKSLEELKRTIPVTDDSAKYVYTRSEGEGGEVKYVFLGVESVVQAVVRDGDLVGGGLECRAGEVVGLVLERTCLYHEAGGQQSDRGVVEGPGWRVECDSVVNCGGYLVHQGTLRTTDERGGSGSKKVLVGSSVRVTVDETLRLATSANHTATHCLNAALHDMFVTAHQRGSSVTDSQLFFDFATYKEHITKDHIEEAERVVRSVVAAGLPVSRTTVSAAQLAAMDDVTLLPGQTYPSQDIHLIQIAGDNFLSKEACCGTHVLNTRDIGDFCIIGVKNEGASMRSLTVVTGEGARQARTNGQQAESDISQLIERIQTCSQDNLKLEELDGDVQILRRKVCNINLPQDVRTDALLKLKEATGQIKTAARNLLRLAVADEMKEVVDRMSTDSEPLFLVHHLRATSRLDTVALQKATKMVSSQLPILLFAYSEGHLKARCCVPLMKVLPEVTAEHWLAPVLAALGANGKAPANQDPRLVFNMLPLRLDPADVPNTVERALAVANQTAIKLFKS